MTVETTLDTALGAIAPTYALAMPENTTLPAIVYQRISTAPQRTHTKDGFDKIRVQISIYGKLYATVTATALSIITALENGAAFRFSGKTNRFDVKEQSTDLYRIILEFECWE